MNCRMILEYDGSRYNGWQKQGNTRLTIQGRLESMLTRLTGYEVEVQGSGRTDAGVHARGQCANFHLREERDLEALFQDMNRYLPEDIRILSLEAVPERFHSRLNARAKTYRYQIWHQGKPEVFVKNYFYHLEQELDFQAMRQAADLLQGTHDFCSFCGNRKFKKSTRRTLYSIEILPLHEGKAAALDFRGNGFLQQMVRILTGTLIEVGQGKRTWDSMEEILAAADRQAAGFTAPPQGLFLMNVEYGELK